MIYQAHCLRFFNLFCWKEKRTKMIEKRPGRAHIYKKNCDLPRYDTLHYIFYGRVLQLPLVTIRVELGIYYDYRYIR